MLDDFFSLVRESWVKTQGEKALIWKGYSLACLIVSLTIVLPLILLAIAYGHHFSFHAFVDGKFILLIIAAIIIFIVCNFYALSFFAAVLYLAHDHLAAKPITVFDSIKKVLEHKWAILLSWVLFAFLLNVINVALTLLGGTKGSFTVFYFLLCLWQLIWNISLLEIIIRNEDAFMALANSIKMFFANAGLFVLVALWIWLLTIFGIVTLFIGMIWAIPAQYNAMSLLYDKVRKA